MSLRASVLGALLGAVIAFGTACPDGPTDPTDTDPDSGTDTASDPDGQDLYESHCQGCHGAGGGGTGSGPALAGHLAGKTEQDIRSIVRNGEEQMPPFTADQITDSELDALATYVINQWGS